MLASARWLLCVRQGVSARQAAAFVCENLSPVSNQCQVIVEAELCLRFWDVMSGNATAAAAGTNARAQTGKAMLTHC